MVDKYRVGVIGLGKIAQTQYIPALLRDERTELSALCDISESLARKSTAVFGQPECLAVSSIEELIARRPQVVFVLTHDHEEIVQRLIDEGISVCVEKPLCWSSAHAAALVTRAREKGVKLYACYMKQFDPTFEAFTEQIRAAGEILSVNVQCLAGNNKKWCDPLFPIQKGCAEEKAVSKQMLSKAWDDFFVGQTELRPESQLLLQLGIHQINLLHALLGDYSVDACVRRVRAGKLSISAVFSTSCTPVSFSLVPLFDAPWDWNESYTVICRDRLLCYEPGCPFLGVSMARLRVKDGTNGLGQSELRAGYGNPFAMMIRAVFDSLDGAKPEEKRLSPEQAIQDLRVVETMLEHLRGAK